SFRFVVRWVPALIAVGLFGFLLRNVVDWEFIHTLDFSVLYTYRWALARGCALTLGITALSVFFGFLIGILLAAALRAAPKLVTFFIRIHIELWRNTPLIVQLFWIHFGLPHLTGFSTTPIESGIIAMSLQSSAY